jgi:hypothetical protein
MAQLEGGVAVASSVADPQRFEANGGKGRPVH